jgi:hypothetical protein
MFAPRSIDGRVAGRARVKLVLGAGVVLGTVAVALTLTGSPIAVTGASTAQTAFLTGVHGDRSFCQAGETLPRETSAIRLRAYTFLGPRVSVEALAGSRVIARGERSSGWTAGAVTVPVKGLRTAVSGVTLCFGLHGNDDESVELVGQQTAAALAAHGREGPLPGRVRVEYLRSSSSAWWSLVPQVARRLGLGHAPSSTWSALLALALMGGALALSGRLVLRELR